MDDKSSVCLLCLTKHNTSKTVFRFGNVEQESFRYVFPELALPKPDIPTFICSICLTNLNTFCTFRKECVDNYMCWINSVNKSQDMCNTPEHDQEENKFQTLETIMNNDLKVTKLEQETQPCQTNSSECNIQENNEEANKLQTTNIEEMMNNELEITEGVSHTTNSDEEIIFSEQNNQQLHRYNMRSNRKKLIPVTANPKNTSVPSENRKVKDSDIKVDNKLELNGSKNGSNKRMTTNTNTTSPKTNKSISNNKQSTSDTSSSSNLFKCKKRINSDNNEPSKKPKISSEINVSNTMLKCQYCEKQVPINHVEFHLSTHLSTYGDYKCPICKEKCSHDTNLVKHMYIHSQYKCIICKEMFTDENSFTEHTATHKDIFICEICNNFFSCKQRILYSQQTKKYKCEFCAFDLICNPTSKNIYEWGEPNGPEYIDIY